MGTRARLTITTTGPNGEPRTWVFSRNHDGYPDHTMPVLTEFLNRTKREARPPATRDEAERWLNDAERTEGAKTRDDAAQWPDAWWMEATQPHTPNGPITHTPAGDVSHTYHADLRTRPEDQPAIIANPDPLPPREDILQWTKADLADTALTAEAERNQARNALYKALAEADTAKNERQGWREEAEKHKHIADKEAQHAKQLELRDRVFKALAERGFDAAARADEQKKTDPKKERRTNQ